MYKLYDKGTTVPLFPHILDEECYAHWFKITKATKSANNLIRNTVLKKNSSVVKL